MSGFSLFIINVREKLLDSSGQAAIAIKLYRSIERYHAKKKLSFDLGGFITWSE